MQHHAFVRTWEVTGWRLMEVLPSIRATEMNDDAAVVEPAFRGQSTVARLARNPRLINTPRSYRLHRSGHVKAVEREVELDPSARCCDDPAGEPLVPIVPPLRCRSIRRSPQTETELEPRKRLDWTICQSQRATQCRWLMRQLPADPCVRERSWCSVRSQARRI